MAKEQQLIVDVESFSKENICILVVLVQQISDRLVQVELFNKRMIRIRQINSIGNIDLLNNSKEFLIPV